ncbi:MAG: Mut7-C RNAse domain-containing protein [Phototrophicaceae bacterium]
MNHATFTFHDSLNYFLARRQKYQTINQKFNWHRAIKDMIEAIAPPHPEIELIVVNGKSVGWDYVVQDGDHVDVYPDFEAVKLQGKIRLLPPYHGRPKFILDTHLGRLAAYLRMMGFDTLYENDYDDDVLAEISATEHRILLTRDLGVLKRGIVIYGYFVRNTDPYERLLEISERYKLADAIEPFGRCMTCNGTLHTIEKESVRDLVEADTYANFDDYHQCQSCQKIFWKGSHYEKMQRLIDEVINS